MDFVRSHFGKMQLCTIQEPFCEETSVQLVRIAIFRSHFLQNPYFNDQNSLLFLLKSFKPQILPSNRLNYSLNSLEMIPLKPNYVSIDIKYFSLFLGCRH